MAVRVQTADFDCAAEIGALTGGRDNIGAVVSFTGLVRRGQGAKAIRSMTLEHYPGMTQKELERVEAEARARWPLQGVTIIHRYGTLLPGDNIVLVLTASQHRKAAFEAAEFLMDYLKTSAPFWKKEDLLEGEAGWVEAQGSDEEAAARWVRDGMAPGEPG